MSADAIRSALVRSSGGQDSTTSLFWAFAMGFEGVEAVGFDYGQRHGVEMEQAEKIGEAADVPFTAST